MSFYSKHILPKCLNWVMRNKDWRRHRGDVVAHGSGTGLEIGFGSGLNLPYYTNVTRLYALDPSQELYDLSLEAVAGASFPIVHINASAEQIPLPDNSLDFVVSTWTLCSIPRPEIALKEMFRVLKSGGIFSFVEHGKSPKSFLFKIQNLLTPLSKCIAGGCHLNRNIEKLILDAGFEIQKVERFTQKSKPLVCMYKGVAVVKNRAAKLR